MIRASANRLFFLMCYNITGTVMIAYMKVALTLYSENSDLSLCAIEERCRKNYCHHSCFYDLKNHSADIVTGSRTGLHTPLLRRCYCRKFFSVYAAGGSLQCFWRYSIARRFVCCRILLPTTG